MSTTPSPARNRRERRRPRRGSLERPVSGRMYRVTWALVALPLLVAAFTVGHPEALPKPDLPPSFDATSAARVARDLAERFPSRVPGTAQAEEATAWVRDRLAEYHLAVEEERFEAELPGGGRAELVNLVARPPTVGPQRSQQTIVVMADRDNLGMAPGLDRNASGTATLIELARELSTLTVGHTIIFVSTDGGAWGNLGAAHLAEDAAFRENVLAIVNLDTVAGPGTPRLELAGEDGRSPASALVATAEASFFAESEQPPRHENAFVQLLDLGFPISFYDQAPLLGEGISSITLTAGSSRPVPPGEDGAAFAPERLGQIGRAAQALVLSVDAAAEVASGTESFVYLGGRVLRGFAIQFFLVVALLPVLVATIDLWARLRRRELVLGAALRSYRSRLGVWLWAGGLAGLFAVVGLFPNGDGRPLPLDLDEAQHWPFAALAGLVALAGVGWLVARSRLVPRAPVERSDELAGHLAAMLVLCGIAVAVAVTNTYALLFVLPSLHAWLWAPHVRDSAPWLRAWSSAPVWPARRCSLPSPPFASGSGSTRPGTSRRSSRRATRQSPKPCCCLPGVLSQARSERSSSAATLPIRPRVTARSAASSGRPSGRRCCSPAASAPAATRRITGRAPSRCGRWSTSLCPVRRRRELTLPQREVGNRLVGGDLLIAAPDVHERIRPSSGRDHVRILTGDRVEAHLASLIGFAARPHELVARRFARDRRAEDSSAEDRQWIGKAEKRVDGRPHEKLEAHERGHRVPRQVEDRMVAAHAEGDGPARPHRHAPEDLLDPQLSSAPAARDRAARPTPRRSSRACRSRVAPAPSLYDAHPRIVGDDAELRRHRAGRDQLGGEHEPVRLVDLARAKRSRRVSEAPSR